MKFLFGSKKLTSFEKFFVPGRVFFETSFDSKQVSIRNKFRFETTETGTETNFGTIRNKMFVSVVSLLYRNREFGCFD
jgi:hypothetical protein